MGFFLFLLFFFFLFLILFFITKYVCSKEIPSSSSSSSASASDLSVVNIPQGKYDVFLSFRGEDTRNSFTAHLYQALLRNKIETFIDNQLIRGDEISLSLLNAIERSTISIIVFSEGYASSGWCLDELVKILECKNMYGQIVIPIFHHVDPSHVRNQTGTFGESFLKLKKRLWWRFQKQRRWKAALKEAANLSGFDSFVIRYEPELIQNTVEDVLRKLEDILKKFKDRFPSDFNEDLMGVESRIEEIESLLSHEAMDVYTLGIWGMGGIGKTTIARAFFSKISSQFDGSCFLSNIREESEKIGGLTQLRRELFFTLLGDENLNMGFRSFDLNFEIKRLSRKKVLIVFDDVTNFEQINFLIGSFNRLLSGSLIMVTTRDKQIFKNCGVKIIYEMKKLVDVDALELFCWHAFRQSHPDASYEQLSNKVMQYAQGVPLVLRVLGCFLNGMSEREWECQIKKLESIPPNEVQRALEISYDGLDDKVQKIFLDIACFFNGQDKDLVEKFLDASGLFPEIGIRVLVNRSLINISNNKVIMHDLLQGMGREIVRQESVDFPKDRSRLWNHEDVYQVLTWNMGTEAIQGIYLNMDRVEEISLNLDTFKQMRNLRFLKFVGMNKFRICDYGSEGYIFHKLSYLHWNGCPLKSLSSNIRAANIVVLVLRYSKVEQLWDGVQNLVSLREIDLRFSRQLMNLPNLSKAQNLEKLILVGCSTLKKFSEISSCNLEKLHLNETAIEELPSSIDCLSRLDSLYLQNCKALLSLPSNLFNLKSLQFLNLSYCSNLKSLPEISSCNLGQLYIGGTAIEELPSSIEFLSRLHSLGLENCSRLKSLPSSLCKLKSLRRLYLTGCANLQRLPEEIGNLDSLRSFRAERTGITEVPSSIVCLKNLGELYLERLRGHEQIGSILPPSLSLDSLHKINYLKLIGCGITMLPKSLFKLSSLVHLDLGKNKFETIPNSIINLSKLERLNLNQCKKLQSLPLLPDSLLFMEANDCSSLEALSELPNSLTTGPCYVLVSFRNCLKLDQNELKNIFTEALRKIQFLVIAQLNRVYNSYIYNQMCFPGSEIPEFFKFQNMGSSLFLEMPSGVQFNTNVLFTFCLIVSFGDHHESDQNFEVICQRKIKTTSVKFSLMARIGYVKSDHVIVGFNTFPLSPYECDFGDYCYNKEAIFEFQLLDSYGKRMDCCRMVKKCGIHLFW